MGGAERALFNLLAGGLAERFQCQVISLADEGVFAEPLRELGVPVYALGMRRGLPTPRLIQTFSGLVKDAQPDVIQGWMYHGNLAGALAQKLAPVKPNLAWNVRHSLYNLSDERYLTRWVIRANRWLSNIPDSLIYNSRLSQRQHNTFGFRSERSQVIPNGFDLKRHGTDTALGQEMRRSLGIPHAAKVIGHVGRFHPMKDHARFVRVAVRLIEANQDMHILLIGRDVVAENRALQCLVPERLKSRFHFLGERNDVPDLMRAMDLFCQSAWSEAFPNVLGEAMATGVPCVATDVGDSALIVDNTGVMVPPRDDSALFNGLMEMLRHPPEVRQTLGEKARMRIETNYSLGAVVDQYIELYHRLSDTRKN